jgi:hypothetical protein
MRLMYWYALTPVVIVFGGLVFLTIPYLALAVLTIVSLGALVGLAWAIVAVPYMLGHAISRRWHGQGAGPRTAAVHIYGHPLASAPRRSADYQSAGEHDGARSEPTLREGHV